VVHPARTHMSARRMLLHFLTVLRAPHRGNPLRNYSRRTSVRIVNRIYMFLGFQEL
jgi:hypothetical protein